MTTRSLTFLEIPENCWLDKPLFKKLFLDHGELDATEKKALSEDVERIRWRYTLKPDTINLAPYADDQREYLEVAVLTVELADAKRINRLAGLIHRAIPYPLIIVFECDGKLAFSVAEKRINQADKSRLVIEDRWLTGWIDLSDPSTAQETFLSSIGLSRLPSTNFYALYQAFVAQVIALIAAERTGTFAPATVAVARHHAETLQEINTLDREIAELRAKLKKETQMSGKILLNSEIKKHKDAIVFLEQKLDSNNIN
ncbi:DUF4391 domain-containing protein [Maritalea sp. S77]|uniref:DUF4391 domain-containing protein n=1 Tax=Maritalea sp. S77 TaxID=3415125 RepID=UPI003C7D2676